MGAPWRGSPPKGCRGRSCGLRPEGQAFFALAQVRLHLALDALQSIVDGLGRAADALADLLVRAAIEVEREGAALELTELAGEAADQSTELFCGNGLGGRIERRR